MKLRLLLVLSALALWCWTHPPVLQIWSGRDDQAVRYMRAHGAVCWPTLHGVRIQANGGGVQALAEWCRHLQLSRAIVSENIANIHTVKTAEGTPYRRQFVRVDEQGQSQIGTDQSDYNWVYDPTNPDAVQEGDHKGYVAMPNVNEQYERECLNQIDQQFQEYHQALKELSQTVDPHGRMLLDPRVGEEPAPAVQGVCFESILNSLPAQPAAQERLCALTE